MGRTVVRSAKVGWYHAPGATLLAPHPDSTTCHNVDMRFKTGLIAGLAAGYVLGAKAGRERYDQIVAVWNGIRGNEQLAAAVDKAADVTEVPRHKARSAVGNGLRSASEAIRNRTTPD
jgi:hypothetical protein